jgi:hypothetical protein
MNSLVKMIDWRSLIAALAFFTGCKQPSQTTKAEWLIGNWVTHFPEADVYESWKRVNDHELAGYSYTRQQGDSIPFESIQLIENENGLHYIVTGAGHPSDSSVRFTASQVKDDFLQFENPQHDFPTRIRYRRVTPDSIYAEISGMQAGREERQGFPLQRVKP